jgi:hypothetical protein
MRFIIQFFGFGKTGLVVARQKTAADDGNVAGNIFVRPESWSASEFKFPSCDATRVPAAAKAQKPVDFARVARWPRRFLNSLNRTAQRFLLRIGLEKLAHCPEPTRLGDSRHHAHE